MSLVILRRVMEFTLYSQQFDALSVSAAPVVVIGKNCIASVHDQHVHVIAVQPKRATVSNFGFSCLSVRKLAQIREL